MKNPAVEGLLYFILTLLFLKIESFFILKWDYVLFYVVIIIKAMTFFSFFFVIGNQSHQGFPWSSSDIHSYFI